MRVALTLAVVLIAGCATEKQQLAPPAGVDFSGHWKLNDADSDNPQRLIQSQIDRPATSQSGLRRHGGFRRARGGAKAAGAAEWAAVVVWEDRPARSCPR
jgi:hypothetical protein